MDARRLDANPILAAETDDRLGGNLNGPSLIRAPDWVRDPLAKYYLYFAHHSGEHIRLTYADSLDGPWKLHTPGVVPLDEASEGIDSHVASPDVHVDDGAERVQLYYHGCCDTYVENGRQYDQFSRLAVSEDGLDFAARPERLTQFYLRVFEYEGAYYGLAKENRGDETVSGQRVYRSADGLSRFEPGPLLFRDGSRHTALQRRGDTLDVFYSRIADVPERILHATVDLSPEWSDWTAGDPETLLEPEHDWEGAGKPLAPSTSGAADGRVRQLRDPGIYVEGTDVYLLYTVAGESGIAVAALAD